MALKRLPGRSGTQLAFSPHAGPRATTIQSQVFPEVAAGLRQDLQRKEEIAKRDRERVLWSKADRQGGLPCPGRDSDDRSASRLWNHASCCRAASPHPRTKSNTCSSKSTRPG